MSLLNANRLNKQVYIEFSSGKVICYSSRKVTHMIKDLIDGEVVLPPKLYCHLCLEPEPYFDTEEQLSAHELTWHQDGHNDYARPFSD